MIQIKVPPLGESIVEATISRWLRNEGDAVAAGDPLVELETDKITVEVPALKAGVLTKRLRAEGDVVKVDELLGELDDTAVATAATAAVGVRTTPASVAARVDTPRITAESEAGVKASPAARRIADQSGIDLSTVAGTGRGGVVSKPDLVEQAGRQATQRATPAVSPAMDARAPTPPGVPAIPSVPAQPARGEAARAAPAGVRETREKMTTRRKRIAEHLLESQHSTAHLTTFNEVDMSAVIAVRDRLKERIEKEHGVKLTFMPFFAKAACMALEAYPRINAQVEGDTIVYKHYVNLGIAVASDQGLVVPVIKDADQMGMLQFSRDTRRHRQARARRQAHDR